MICPFCGFPNYVVNIACPSCGANELTDTPAKRCPSCFGPLNKRGKCPTCKQVTKIELPPLDTPPKVPIKWWTIHGSYADAQTPRSTPQGAWDRLFMDIAKNIAAMSKCASRKVGAIVVRDRQILSMGYNGSPAGSTLCQFPGGIDSSISSRCPRKRLNYPSGAAIELCPAQHAEENTVANAARNGIAILGATLYCYCGMPCQRCAGALINAGIVKVVCLKEEEHYDKLAERLFSEAGVEIQTI